MPTCGRVSLCRIPPLPLRHDGVGFAPLSQWHYATIVMPMRCNRTTVSRQRVAWTRAKAVECGYWHLWRYNPALAEQGKNPFSLDSKEPQWDKFQAYLDGEVRFLSLKKSFPGEAQELYNATQAAALKRYKSYVRKTKEDWSE